MVRPVNSYQGFMLKSTATAQTPALTDPGDTELRNRVLCIASTAAIVAFLVDIYLD